MMKSLILSLLTLLTVQAKESPEQCQKIIMSGIDALYAKEYAKSLELLTEAKATADANHWYKQSFLASNNIGLNYYYMLDYGEALDNYLNAYKIAVKSLDGNFEMIVLNNIAVLYLDDKKFDEAEKYFSKAYAIAKRNKNDVKTGMYAGNLATVANQKNQLAKADEYLNIAMTLLKNEPRPRAQVEVTKAENLLLKKEYKAAEAVALNILPNINAVEFNRHKVAVLMALSKIYELGEHDFDKATKMVQNALQVNLDLKIKAEIYDRLADLSQKTKGYDNAFKYKDSVVQTRDSLSSIKNKMLFANSRIKLELQDYQKELSNSEKKLASERRISYIIIGLALLIILAVVWALRNNAIKFRQKRIITEGNQKILTLELENQLREKELAALKELEAFKNELEEKNRKLAVKALHSASRNELIEDIVKSLSAQPEISGNPALKKHLLQLKNHLRKDNEWDDFLTHFEEVNHGFLVGLKAKHPELTSNDIRFLLYIYMNLSIKEIAALFNITQEACRKRKERIVKKMELSDQIDLYHYLSVI